MKVFYGGAIQGNQDRTVRAHVYRYFIDLIKKEGFEVSSEHTSGKSIDETAFYLEQAMGSLPPPGIQRTRFVRDHSIRFVEGDIAAAIFEVSTPSLGTGIEFAHAYLRPRLGLPTIPILALYQDGYWSGKLSTMIRGLTPEEFPHVQVVDYKDLESARPFVEEFLRKLNS